MEGAKYAALEAGIIDRIQMDEEFVCMEGWLFEKTCEGIKAGELGTDRIGNLKTFVAVEMKLKVLAGSTPLYKYVLVLGLQELNNVVAVTAHGVLDVIALQ